MNFGSALVTGASGFIGRRLIRALADRAVRVMALTRGAVAFPPGVEVVQTTSFDTAALRSVLSDLEFDVLFHLAAYGVSPGDCDPNLMQAINVAATGALVELAAESKARAVVYAGSCSEYQPRETGRLIDEDWSVTTDNMYGASKFAGGLRGRAVATGKGLAFSWVRLFGVYGPGEAPHRLIPNIVSQLRRDQTVSLTPGKQMRDLTYVDDVVNGLILAVEAAQQGNIGPYNLCTGRPIAIEQVARLVASKMGKPETLLGFSMRPYRPGEPMWMVGCPDRFRSVTGYVPAIDLDEGVGRAIAAIKD
jgi:nucleoside-diphosphate-sugar epimerase